MAVSAAQDARSAARKLLEQKGGTLDLADVAVPGFVKPQPVEKLRRKFFGLFREIRKWTGVFSILFFVVLIGLAGVSEELKIPALEEARDAGIISSDEFFNRGEKLSESQIADAKAQGMGHVLETWESNTELEAVLIERARRADLPAAKRQALWENIGLNIGVGVWMATIASWFTFSILRTQPGRILLLRKFNNKTLGKAMANVITTELRPFGHVLTLEDKHIKAQTFFGIRGVISPNPVYAVVSLPWLPFRLLLRQFNRTKWGPAWVGSARNFRCLAKRLRERMSLNLEVSWKAKREAFIVRTSDQWWQEVIALMMHSSDVIVVDLSEVTSGTQWELERIDRLQEWRRAVFTAHEEREDRARDVLAEYDWGEPDLYLYDKLGDMHDQKAFRMAMLTAMERRVNAGSGASKTGLVSSEGA